MARYEASSKLVLAGASGSASLVGVRCVWTIYNRRMVRLSELHPVESTHLAKRAEAMPAIGPGEWVTPSA